MKTLNPTPGFLERPREGQESNPGHPRPSVLCSAAQLHIPKTQVPRTGSQWGSVRTALFVQTPRPHVHTDAQTSVAGTPELPLAQQPADLRTGGPS